MQVVEIPASEGREKSVLTDGPDEKGLIFLKHCGAQAHTFEMAFKGAEGISMGTFMTQVIL